MKKVLGILAVLLAVFMMLAGAAHAADETGRIRDIAKQWPAAGITKLELKGNVGDVRIRGGAGNEIRLELRLEGKRSRSWLGRSREGDPYAVELDARTSGDTLLLDLRGDRERVEEKWTLEIPERLAARVELGVGEMNIRGLSGGVHLRLGVGDINAEVLEGDIDAEVGVGDARIRTSSKSYGRVSLEASVGDTHLELPNHTVKYPKPAGAGNRISLDGTGKDRIRVEAGVGDARLTIR